MRNISTFHRLRRLSRDATMFRIALDGSRDFNVRQFGFAGVIEESDNPLRVLQAIETIWNGNVGYQDGKMVLLAWATTRDRFA